MFSIAFPVRIRYSLRGHKPWGGTVMAAGVNAIVNDLIELDRLVLIRDEHRAIRRRGSAEHLDEPIKLLAAKLPKELASLCRKMHEKGMPATVPIANGICSGCGLSLPVSLVQSVRASRDVVQCHNCTRVLYCLDELPRRVRTDSRRVAQRQSGVARLSSLSLMIPSLASSEKEDVLRELAEKMEVEGIVDDSEKLVEAALKREAAATTAMDGGMAFPHVRNVEGGGLAFALGISRKGVKYGAPSNRLTRIFFLTVIPTASNAFYLKLLADLMRVFSSADARQRLLATRDAQALWTELTKLTRSVIR